MHIYKQSSRSEDVLDTLYQCFLTAGPRPGTGPGINYTGRREVLLEFAILVL